MIAMNVTRLNLSAADMTRHIQKLAEKTEKVFFTKHALDRMEERRVTTEHVFTCLQKGNVFEIPFCNVRGEWECNVIRQVAGLETEIAVRVKLDEKILIITVI
tara:strand:+ start:274 stop:582 length:309 start_codon:yes stop_codon:yes gene_type:complete